jgi:hypothetical protein
MFDIVTNGCILSEDIITCVFTFLAPKDKYGVNRALFLKNYRFVLMDLCQRKQFIGTYLDNIIRLDYSFLFGAIVCDIPGILSIPYHIYDGNLETTTAISLKDHLRTIAKSRCLSILHTTPHYTTPLA